MSENTNPNLQEIDLQKEVTQILLTVKLLEKPYAGAYIARILTGENQFGWRSEFHPQLESFGSISHYFRSQIEDIIYYVVDLNFISVKDDIRGTLEVSQLGEAYLSQPRPLLIEKGKIFKPWYEIELTKQIRTWRNDLAQEFFKKPYQIFSNYVLTLLVKKLPGSLDALAQIQGLDALSDEERLELSQIIQEMKRKIEVDEKSQIYRKAYAPSKRKVKELFQAGLSLEEIARRRKLKVSTTREYLMILHQAKEINLIPWIEEKMDPLVLHKIVEYFKSAQDRSLKVAHKVLEQDYETLKLGRMFAEERMAEAA